VQAAPVSSKPAPQAQGFQLAPVTPQAGLTGRSLPAIGSAQTNLALAQLNLEETIVRLQGAPENNVCYTIRSYDFARDGADSDATRLTGSSTCRPSSKNKLKGAVRVVR